MPGQRRLAPHPGIGNALQQLRIDDVLVFQHLAGAEQLAAGNTRLAQLGEHLPVTALRTPLRHALADQLPVVAARLVAGKALVLEPLRLAHQPGPAPEQSATHDLYRNPAVGGPEGIGGRVVLAARAATLARQAEHRLLDERRIVERQRRAEQGGLDELPFTGLPSMQNGREDAEGTERRRPEVTPGREGLGGLIGKTTEIHGPGHGLRHRVEATARGVGPARAERRTRGEDDVGLHGTQRVVIESQLHQRRPRQVGDHHVGGAHESFHDFASPGRRQVEGDAALVAADLQVVRALALLAHGHRVAVLAPGGALDTDHVRAEVRKDRGGKRAGDVAAEIDDPDIPEDAIPPAHAQRSRIVTAVTPSSTPRKPPPFSATAIRAPDTCRSPASPRSCCTSS